MTFGSALRVLLRADALGSLGASEAAFARDVLRQLPAGAVAEIWPYGALSY